MAPADADVIVIGAGFAGLTAARELSHRGISTLVLEARERTGGRVWTTHELGGIPVDRGGQWLAPTHSHALRLAEEAGANVFETHHEGENVLVLRGHRSRYRGTIPSAGPVALANLAWAMMRLDAIAKRIDLDCPMASSRAKELDRQSLGQWLRRNTPSRRARDLLTVGLESVFAAHPDDISLLHAAFYVHAGGGLDPLLAIRKGAQAFRVEGGMQRLTNHLARGLSIVSETIVDAIDYSGDHVEVRAGARAFRAARAIVTLPPPLLQSIAFSPRVPARASLLDNAPMGSVMKVIAVYDRPFWRERGLSGHGTSDTGPVFVVFDNHSPGDARGILLGFVEAREADRLDDLEPVARRAAVLESIARIIGPEASEPEAYIEQGWRKERHSAGCYAAIMPPGAWSAIGRAWRQADGRVHWAGTETASLHHGYIEGAIRSGIRAAQEVAEALG